MSVSTHIMELARQVRGSTIELLEAARPEWLLWAPAGTSNHILWHAGHAIWLQEALCLQPLTGQSHLQPGWAETFGMNCRPPAETHGWPTEQSLAFQLRLQLEEILMACTRHADRLAFADLAASWTAAETADQLPTLPTQPSANRNHCILPLDSFESRRGSGTLSAPIGPRKQAVLTWFRRRGYRPAAIGEAGGFPQLIVRETQPSPPARMLPCHDGLTSSSSALPKAERPRCFII